jgi:hypothetical protein
MAPARCPARCPFFFVIMPLRAIRWRSPIVSGNKSSDRIQTKKAAVKIRTQVRKISDMFLEIGPNVGLVACRDELGVAEISNWPVGDIGTVNKQNMSLQA